MGFGISDVDNDEVGEVTQQPHRLGEVLGLGLVEVEDHRQVTKAAEFLSQLPAGAHFCSIAPPLRADMILGMTAHSTSTLSKCY